MIRIARNKSEAKYPSLWEGRQVALAPFLGPTGTTLVDRSGNALHGTLTNMDSATDWVRSDFGYSLDFDGSNDYVAVGTSSTFNAPSALTISVWARPTSAIDLVSVIGKYVSGPENGWIIETGTSGFGGTSGVLLTACNGGSHYGSASSIFTVNEWVHIVYVFNGTGAGNSTRLRFYRNGNEVTLTYTGTIPTSIGSNASAPRIGSNGDGRYWAGQIDDVAVYNRVLSPTEIRVLALRRGIAYEARGSSIYSRIATGSPWYYYAQQAVTA